MTETIQDRLRKASVAENHGTYLVKTELGEDAADALDAAQAEIAELKVKVAGLEGCIEGMRDAAWNEAIEAAALITDRNVEPELSAFIRELKR